MRRRILLFALIIGLGFGLSSCVYEEPVIVQVAVADADVSWEYWAGPRFVEIDGEIFNDGNTFLRTVELEFIMYDEFGRVIDVEFVLFDVFLDPGEADFFAVDFRVPYVFDVDVRVLDVF